MKAHTVMSTSCCLHLFCKSLPEWGKKEHSLTQSVTKEPRRRSLPQLGGKPSRGRGWVTTYVAADTGTVSVYEAARSLSRGGNRIDYTFLKIKHPLCCSCDTPTVCIKSQEFAESLCFYTRAACRKRNRIWQYLELRLFFYRDRLQEQPDVLKRDASLSMILLFWIHSLEEWPVILLSPHLHCLAGLDEKISFDHPTTTQHTRRINSCHVYKRNKSRNNSTTEFNVGLKMWLLASLHLDNK